MSAVSPAWVAFGLLLRDRRNLLAWSRVKLAKRAKLSDSTIKFIETGRHKVSRATLLRLFEISELRLSWADLSDEREPATQGITPPGIIVSGGCTPLAAVADLRRFFDGAGGYMPQAYAYADCYSAAAYLKLSESDCWPTATVDKLAALVLSAAHTNAVQLVALGVDAGKVEALTCALLTDRRCKRVDRCLVDSSLPLLTHAVISQRLPGAWGVLGQLLELPLLSADIARVSQPGSRRLWAVFALSDLDESEARFFQYGLAAAAVPGDLLLLDVALPDAASAAVVSAELRSWLGGLVARHCPDPTHIAITATTHRPASAVASVVVDVVATVRNSNRQERAFSVFRSRHYQPDVLSALLGSLGWRHIETIESGARAQLLFQLSDVGH